MTAPQNSHDRDHDFRQLTGAFDRPIAPSPHFAEALKQRLNEEETSMQQVMNVPDRPVSHRTARAAAQPLPRRKVLDIAIAAAVIIGMLGSTFWYASTRIGGDDPNDPGATQYAAQPLSAVATPEAEAGGTGDPGNTANYPAGFDPTAAHETIVLESGPSSPVSAAVSGDTLVVSGSLPGAEDPESQGLMAIDLVSGKALWSVDIAPWGNFLVSGDRIVGVFEQAGEGNYYGMTSISLQTGEVAWTSEHLIVYGGPDVAYSMSPAMSFRPVVYEDAVYYADTEGNIQALDALTGAPLWDLPIGTPVSMPGPESGVAVVGDTEFLYAVDSENAIRKIDRHTGEVIDRFEVPDRDPFNHELELHVDGDLLVNVVRTSGTEGESGFIDAMATSTGERLWTQRIGNAGPFITMTDRVVAVPHHVQQDEVDHVSSGVTEPGYHVSFLDRTTGELASLYGPSDAGTITVSASSSVVCMNERAAIGCIDTARKDLTFVTLPYAPGNESAAPLLYWNDTAIVLDMDDGVTLLQPRDTQPQQAMMFPGDPGHTSAWAEPFDINGPLRAYEMEGYPGYAASGTIVGDILIAENKHLAHKDPPTFAGSGIYAQDLTTGEILWRNTEQVHQRYAADASGVYILPQPGTNVQRLIALDLETGEERWTSDPLRTYSSFPDAEGILHAGSPIAIDGTVYVPMVDGVVLAFDGATGEIAWQYEPMAVTLTNGDATIAGDEDRIYAVAGDNVITVLYRETGALERTFVLEGLPPTDYSLWPHIQGNHLIMEASAKGNDTPRGIVVAVDANSGEELWRQETGVIQSNVLVTPDRVGVVHASFEDPSIIERIFTDTQPDGTLSFSVFALQTGRPIEVPEGVLTKVDGVWSAGLASSGDTICLGHTTVTCFDSGGTVVRLDGYETPPITTGEQELLFWNSHLVILSPLVANHVAAPGTHPMGMPLATPVAATPMATPAATPDP